MISPTKTPHQATTMARGPRYTLSIKATTLFVLGALFVPAVSFHPPALRLSKPLPANGISSANHKARNPSFLTSIRADDNSREDVDFNASSRLSKIQNTNDDPDSTARRQIILSLLSASSLAPFAANAIGDTDSASLVKSAPLVTADVANAASASTVGETVKVLKPPLDLRAYETYELPNGLKVLLCSDPTSTTAAAGMNVHVGACSDPKEVPGLVRFMKWWFVISSRYFRRILAIFVSFCKSFFSHRHIFVSTCFFWELRNIQWKILFRNFWVAMAESTMRSLIVR